MSADRWSHCPRCRERASAHLDNVAAQLDADYGKLPAAEWSIRRRALDDARNSLENAAETFREDYSFSPIDTGAIHVNYRGECIKCHLKLVFSHTHVLEY